MRGNLREGTRCSNLNILKVAEQLAMIALSLSKSIEAFNRFVDGCRLAPDSFGLTQGGRASPYALCFGVFSAHLTRRLDPNEHERRELACALIKNVQFARITCSDIYKDKSYRQLLTLTLSALSILGEEYFEVLDKFVTEQISLELATYLSSSGAFEGAPQSGNQAMFQAIFLLHAGKYCGCNVRADIDLWLDLHMRRMNKFGFWGKEQGPTHLHFQNGYHQYEILEYLGVENAKECNAIEAVLSLADRKGHYAPYPGGGACFDYDAVFLLTPKGTLPAHPAVKDLLLKTFNTLVHEQRADGGFCENLMLRPRRAGIRGYLERILSAKSSAALVERLRYATSLQRPKYNRLATHWSIDARRWSDSDLFSSWFRLLTLARIDVAVHPAHARNWGFIDYPGIGYHPSLRSSQRVE